MWCGGNPYRRVPCSGLCRSVSQRIGTRTSLTIVSLYLDVEIYKIGKYNLDSVNNEG